MWAKAVGDYFCLARASPLIAAHCQSLLWAHGHNSRHVKHCLIFLRVALCCLRPFILKLCIFSLVAIVGPGAYLDALPFAEKVYRRDPVLAQKLYSEPVYRYLRDGVVIFPGVIDSGFLDEFDQDLSLFYDLQSAPEWLGQLHVDGRQEHKLARVLDKLGLNDLRDASSGLRLNDLHSTFESAARIALSEPVTSFLAELFGESPSLLQTLTFFKSSEQPLHQDFSYVQSHARLSELAAAWIPLEDVQSGSGPLVYYPGSHLPEQSDFFDWGDGSVTANYDTISQYHSAYSDYLVRVISKRALEPVTYLPNRGDLLIWHGALIHGGSPISDPSLTRRSFVCHYTSVASHPQMNRYRFQQGFGFNLFGQHTPSPKAQSSVPLYNPSLPRRIAAKVKRLLMAPSA